MTNIIRHASETGRSPSVSLWGDLGDVLSDSHRGRCIFLFDDFGFVANHANAQASGGYFTYQDTGVTITGLNTASDIGEELGVLEVAGNDGDNDEGHIEFGYGNMFRIDNGAGNTGTVIFEARFNKNSVADNGVSVFLGLHQGPVAANTLVDNTGALSADRGFIGFHGLADDGDKLDIVYKENAQTLQTVLANAVTLTADTYVNVGFKYNPRQINADKKIQFYVNGVLVDADISTTNLNAATFPEGTAMLPVFLTKVGTAAESKVHFDWVCAAQYMDGA